MNAKLSIFSVIIICMLGTLYLSCKKDPPKTLPTVATSAATNITAVSATSGGTISNDGGSPVTSRGVCWSTDQSPTINERKTSDGTGLGTFTSSINELLPGVTYNVRAYAINAVGTAYGEQISILTKSVLATHTTPTLLGISSTTISVSCKITSDGGSNIISRGVCWSRKPMPSNNWVDSTTFNGTGIGDYTSSISGLKPGTVYYIRAYATNNIGTAFSDQITANTIAVLPELNTTSISEITSTSATSGGNITYDGGASIISRGVCWSSNQSPSTSDNKTNNGTGTGNYISNISGLSPGKIYYVRAYATNNIGTSYGNQITFTSTSSLPILTTTEPSSILSSSANSGGNITSDGGAVVTSRGVCWNSNGSPTINDSKTTNESGIGSFISNITGLMPNTPYKIRAYATNSVGTSYGNQVSLTTLQGVPTIITTQASNVTQSSITTGGTLINGGGSLVVSKGICYSRSQNPTVNDRTNVNWNLNDNYVCTLTNLEPKTTYYIRAFATNLTGTGYGDQIAVTTLASLAKISTNEITNYTSTTAIAGGNITSDGGETVTLRGVCWNTKGEPIITDSKTSDGSGIGVFSSSMLGLSPSTKYYVRAYATNSIGTIYGNQVTVTTLSPEATVPALTTTAPSEVTSSSIKSGGIIINNGGSSIFSKGICYSRSQNPTVNDRTNVNWNLNDNYVCTLTNLEPKTTYYIRAFATNLTGTGYGNEIAVTTLASLAKITTNEITNYTSTTVVAGGNITSDGGETVTSRGVCWNTKGEPIVTDSKTSDGSGIGLFSSSMLGLTPNTKYYIRAYATNSIGTIYGNQVTVTTLSPEATIPALTTTAPSEVTSNSLKSGGIIINNGGSSIFSKGICYSRSQNPTVNDRTNVNWNLNDNYVCKLTNLEPKTTYYIRAFATNLTGTGYGDEIAVTTLASLAKISTNEITNYTSTTAIGGGNITSDGNEPVSLRGVCWNTKGEPNITDSKTNDGSGTGAFSSSILGLTPNTKYYVRAYATNSIGTIYGNQVTVTTLSPEPTIATLTTTEASNITSASATSGGSITNTGGANIIYRGVCYSRSQNPTINDKTAVDIHTSDNFACILINLEPKTTYYIRAFATNSVGTGYGNQVSFTTKDEGTVIVGTSENIQHIDVSGNFVFQLNNLVNKNVYFIFSNKNTSSSKNLPSISGSVVSVQMDKGPIMDNNFKSLESGTPSISDFNNNPRKYRVTGITKSQYQQYLIERPNSYTLGTSELFYDETGPARRATIRKVISAHGKTLFVWVDDLCWGPTSTKQFYVTQAMVDAFAPKFLNSGTNDDIYEWVSNICGAPWGVTAYSDLIQNTDDIHIWLTDIGTVNAAGYFYGINNFLKTTHSRSNQKIMFAIDAVLFATPDGGVWDMYDYYPQFMISTLAHEFQHMIYFYQKWVKQNLVNDNSAMTEMLSLCVEDLLSNKSQTNGPRGVAYGNATAGGVGNKAGRLPKYNDYNDLTLLSWPNNDVEYYAKAYAFGAYLMRNYGGANLVKAMVQNGYVDYDCIVNAVNANGGGGITFKNILENFGAANILSDRTTMSSGYKYNSGTWFTSSINNIDYKLGSINLYNYSPNPKIHTSLPSIQNAASNVYYIAGTNLSGTHEWSFTGLNSDVKLTVIIK